MCSKQRAAGKKILFQKPCIFIPNTSENKYNIFLQHLKKLPSQSFL